MISYSHESFAQHNQDDTFISLYADKAKGILMGKCFLKLTDVMEKEQEGNQNYMQQIVALISEEERYADGYRENQALYCHYEIWIIKECL